MDFATRDICLPGCQEVKTAAVVLGVSGRDISGLSVFFRICVHAWEWMELVSFFRKEIIVFTS
eukprot:807393-Amorphochlora_amoeboformis.AAC.1